MPPWFLDTLTAAGLRAEAWQQTVPPDVPGAIFRRMLPYAWGRSREGVWVVLVLWN